MQRPPAAPACDAEADDPEFDAFAREQDPVALQAAHWAARLRDGLTTEADPALRAWLAQDPRHAAALAEMVSMLTELKQLPGVAHESVQALRALSRPAPPSPIPRQPAPPPGSWRPWWSRQGRSARGERNAWSHSLALAGLAALVLGGGGWLWSTWENAPQFEQRYSTLRGQQLLVKLPDDPTLGSQLQLDTQTALDTRLSRQRREVRLQEGQVMFSVHADAQRPFHVLAGPLDIRVVGTRFSVRHTQSGLGAGQTLVAVEEGRVQVSMTGSATPAAVLGAGQAVRVGDDGQLSPIETLPPERVAAWREGRISFDRTPLAQALAEFERYGPTRLVLADPALGQLEVGGSFDPGQYQAFARMLPLLLPVRLVQRDGLTEIVAR